jgi:RHS repeat-associated protein
MERLARVGLDLRARVGTRRPRNRVHAALFVASALLANTVAPGPVAGRPTSNAGADPVPPGAVDKPPVAYAAPFTASGTVTCDDFNRPDQVGLGSGPLGLWQVPGSQTDPSLTSIVSGEARLLRNTGLFATTSYIGRTIGPSFDIRVRYRILNSAYNVFSFGAGTTPFLITTDPPSSAFSAHVYRLADGLLQVQARAMKDNVSTGSGHFDFTTAYPPGAMVYTRIRVVSPETLFVKTWYASDAEPLAFAAVPITNGYAGQLQYLSLNETNSPDGTTPNPEARVDEICVDDSPPPPLSSEQVPDETDFNNHPNVAVTGDPVNSYTGSLAYTHHDAVIPGRGPAIDFARTYNSNDTRVGRLGPGWTDSYAARVVLADDSSGDVYVVGPEGRRDRYAIQADGTYARPPAIQTTLIKEIDGSFTATHKDRSSWIFDSGGRLAAIRDRYGNTSTLSYGTGGRLTSIADPAGRGSLTLGYTNGLLTSITDWASPVRTVTYQYDGNNRLWKVTDREGKTTTYTYDGASHRIATITDARGKVLLTNTYDAQGRVATQQDARGLTTGDVTTYAYVVNPDGTRVTSITAPATSFEPAFLPTVEDTYDANGWLVQRRTRPTSTETLTQLFTYDALGNRTSVTDPRGNRTDYCYDVDYAGVAIPGGSDNVTRAIGPSPSGGLARPVTLTAYDALDNVVQTVAPKGVPSGTTVTCGTDLSAINTTYATDHAYDPTAAFLLSTTTRFTDPDAGAKTAITKFEYLDALNPGLVTRQIPPRGNTGANPDYTYATAFSYYTTGTQAGLLKDVTDPLGNKTSFAYDPVGRRISLVDQLGNAPGAVGADHTTTWSYDKEDRVRFHRVPAPVAGGSQLATETRYDEVGNPVVRIDANLQVTTYAYDERNSLYQVKESPLAWTDPASPPAQIITTEYTRDAGGNPTRMTRAKGDASYERVTDYTYDGRGLPRSERQYPAWPSTSGPLVTTFGYDAAGNLTTVVDPQGRTLTTGFDSLGRRTSLDYSDPATPDVTLGYDANGNRTSMLDGTGSTSYVYDESDRPISVTSPGPKLVGYRYDLDGNRTKLIYPDATAVTYTYDKGSHLASLSDWASRQLTYQYWPDGLVKQATNPNATTATYTYDNARRLFDIRHARTTGQQIDRFYYTLDGVGNVLSAANGSLATQFARPDGLAGSSGTWTGTFASINEVTANDTTFLASPLSPTTEFYEVTLSDVDLPGTTTGIVFRYRYAKSGNNSGKTTNVTVELRQGSIVIASQAHTNIPGVDGSGWQQGNITLTPAQAALITNAADLRLRFRPSSSGGGQGRQALVSWAVTELPGVGTPSSLTSYTYDRLSRLTGSTSSTGSRGYTYDPVGNRLTRVDGGTTTYGYDRADRMTSAGALSVNVDANGNLTTKGPDTFAFDQANRLRSSTVSGATESYIYDGDGRRFSRQIGAGTPIRYVSDSVGDLAATLDDGSRKYVYGLGLAYAVSGASIEIYHTDNLGSTRALTDGAGATVATYKSDDWGRSTGGTGSSTQPFAYTGQPRDQSGLTYLRTRYYDADLGRFLSRDTWPGVPGSSQTQNRFAYVSNNPTTERDPSGRIIDTALDVGFIVYDVASLVFGPAKEHDANLLALGADVGGLFVPFVTGAGAAVRLERAADHADDALGLGRWVDDAAHACSFTPETLVAARGGDVPISTLEVGDLVFAWDEAAALVVERHVTSVLPHSDEELTLLTLAGGSVTTTPDHPFYVIGTGWVNAGDLWPGARIMALTGPSEVRSRLTKRIESTLWDLTVEGAHTFFIGPGRWLVHNCPRPTTTNLHGGSAEVSRVLDDASEWLGPGYTEIAPGVFRSADGARQFRMTTSDLTSSMPHVQFESIGPDGRWIIENSHVYLIDP